MSTSSSKTAFADTVEIVAAVSRLLHRASNLYLCTGDDLASACLASHANLAAQHAAALLPDAAALDRGLDPLARDPGELIGAAERLLRQVRNGSGIAGLPGLIADVCDLVRETKT